MSITTEDQEFRRRLRLIMQQFGSVADLARAVGVSDNAIYKWVSGRGQPSMVSLVNLARAARVSVEWLATGQEAGAKDTRDSEAGEYTYLPRHLVRAQAGRVAMQSPQIVDYIAPKSEWLMRRLGAEPKNLILMEVVGDAMSPTIDEGDLALVDLRELRYRYDGIYALRSGGEIALKRLQRRPDGRLTIHSDNPNYEPAIVTSESITVLGRVIWIGGSP
jgi:phage repressor protein C with HTH and peptisase S24 domain